MELLLALAVITAVIIFGALISLGNERQRKAIDELREHVVLWAIRDLRIKRERLAREVCVEDPMEWLNRIAANSCGYDLKLQKIETFNEPYSLVCASGNENGKVIFTPFSPDKLHNFQRKKRGRLSQIPAENPLLFLHRRATSYEISTLNSNLSFDLELPLVWNRLTGQRVLQLERIWMYIIH